MDTHHDSLPETPEPYQHDVLVGHNAVLADLWNAYRAGNLPHGMLFAGPCGIGKATTAFALARLIYSYPNAKEAPELAQATINTIQSSLIASGGHSSLKHLTRAVNDEGKGFKTGIGVDGIRKVGHFLSMSADGGLARIVIVDPADDMNANAANALLKNLEEPPKNTFMVLITHQLGRLLPTIRSRCRVVRFKPLADKDVIALLMARGYQHDDASALCALADGSVREAIIHDQYGGMDIANNVDQILSGTSFAFDTANQLAAAISANGADIQFGIFNQLIDSRVMQAAQIFARQGNRQSANTMAALQGDLQARRNKALGLNLDRSLYVSNTLRLVHGALL